MGHTTKLSDYENERATTIGPVCEGVDIEAEAEKDAKTTKSKVVEPEKKAPAKTTTARTKSK